MWGSIWRSEDRSTTMTRANEMISQLFGTATKTVVLNGNYKIMRYVWCYTLYMSRDQHSSLFAMSNLRLRAPKKLKLSWRGYVRFCEHVGTCVMDESSIWTRLMKSCTMGKLPVSHRFCSSNCASLEMRKNPKSQRKELSSTQIRERVRGRENFKVSHPKEEIAKNKWYGIFRRIKMEPVKVVGKYQ